MSVEYLVQRVGVKITLMDLLNNDAFCSAALERKELEYCWIEISHLPPFASSYGIISSACIHVDVLNFSFVLYFLVKNFPIHMYIYHHRQPLDCHSNFYDDKTLYHAIFHSVFSFMVVLAYIWWFSKLLLLQWVAVYMVDLHMWETRLFCFMRKLKIVVYTFICMALKKENATANVKNISCKQWKAFKPESLVDGLNKIYLLCLYDV